MVYLIFSSNTGFEVSSLPEKYMALGLIVCSAFAITQTTITSKLLTDDGVSPSVIMSIRFSLLTSILLIHSLYLGELIDVMSNPALLLLFFALGLAFIVFPNFCFQQSLKYVSAVTAEVFNACTPAIIFLIQFLDSGIEFSRYTAIGILLYIATAIPITVTHYLKNRKRVGDPA